MAERPNPPAIIGISYLAPPAGAPPSAQPRSLVEQALLEIWGQVLPAPAAGPETNFFEIGGDSLLATQVVARARQVFGVELALDALFEQPTLAGMAELVTAALRRDRPPAAPPLAPRARAGLLPLSFAQERMWFVQQLEPASSAYHIVSGARLRGALDLPRLEAALSELARRHESLRTTFRLVEGQPVQCIGPAEAFHVRRVEVPGADAPERLAQARRLATAAAREPFDLAHGPLLRLTAYRLAADDHLLVAVMHHIISDAWSMSVLGRELQALQEAQRRGIPAALPELPIQYADFAAWQREWMQGAALEAELAYWRPQLAGLKPLLRLPLDHPRPSVQTYPGASQSAKLDPAVLQQLRQLSQAAGTTLSMTLLAAFQVLLQRYTGEDDIAVALPIANRRWLAVEGLVGMFVNTLVLRSDLSGAPSFRELLRRVRQTSLEAYAHQDMPFAKLVAEINPERSLSHSPLVQVMFNHINLPTPNTTSLTPFERRGLEIDPGGAQFDLTLTVLDQPAGQQVLADYNTDLFEAETITRLLGHFANLLRGIAADPDTPIAVLPLLGEAERQQLLMEWNDTRHPYPAASLTELFEAQVGRTPDAVALRLGQSGLGYAALNQRANQIGHYLQRLGVGAETRVAVCLPRSFDAVAALLAVLKSGAAYVPLDPAYPAERLRFMLADSQARVMLTRSTLVEWVASDLAARVVALDRDAAALSAESAANLGQPVPPQAAACVIYTSGSTGQPKGVLASQRGAVNRCQWMWEAYPFAAGEVACHKTSLSFVDSVAEIFGPLLWGVPLVLAPEETVPDPARLMALLAVQGVTRLVVVPSLLRALLETGDLAARLPKLWLWVVSGEALEPALLQAFQAQLPAATLLNLYGSSEVAGDVTYYDCRAGATDGGVPIGRPIANSQVYVLDEQRQPVPVGVPGTIYVGGAGLALGYLNRPELTAARFVAHPFSPEPGARLFCTGDLGRYRPDGNLLVLGRRDRQVKVRGVRVELDELTAALGAHAGVSAAAVRLGPGGDLEGYYVLKPGTALPASELRRDLAQRLPAAMLPGVLVALTALPQLPNGKVDEAALPGAGREQFGLSPARVAPRTALERSLARLWAETLGQQAGITDNFFEVGGHSLLAARLFARIHASLGLDLPVTLLFQAPTIAELAREITSRGAAPGRLSSLAPIRAKGTRPPLFCIHPLGGGVGDYAALAGHLNPEQPFYGLRAKGLDDDSQQALAVEALAADYVSEIRARQPTGPYRLAGYSSGGLIAYEMARQLAEAGEAVALVALLDSYAPRPAGGERWSAEGLANLLASLPPWLDDMARLGRRQLMARVRRKLRAATMEKVTNFIDEADLARLPARHRAFIEAHYQALLAYRPRPCAMPVTLFRAQAQALSRASDPDKGWGKLALGGVEIRAFRGSHQNLLSEPYAGYLAAEVQKKLDELV